MVLYFFCGNTFWNYYRLFLELDFTYSTVFFPVTLYIAALDLSVIFVPGFNVKFFVLDGLSYFLLFFFPAAFICSILVCPHIIQV